jgi:hypothetical protein
MTMEGTEVIVHAQVDNTGAVMPHCLLRSQ